MNEEFYIDSKKTIPKGTYRILVYLLPILICILLGILTSSAANFNFLFSEFKVEVYTTLVLIFIALSFFLKSKWLSITKSRYYYIGDLKINKAQSINGDDSTIAKYYYKKFAYRGLIYGLMCNTNFILSIINNRPLSFTFIRIILFLLIFFITFRGFIYRNPVFIITLNGIWTKKLGFINWSEISFIDVTEKNRLEIWLNYSIYQYAEVPIQSMDITLIKNYETIRSAIYDVFGSHKKKIVNQIL